MRKDSSIASNDTTYSIAAYNTSPFSLSLISFLNVMDNFQWVTGTMMAFLTLLHSSGRLSANQTQNFHSLNHPRSCQFCFILWLWCLITRDLSGCNFRSFFFPLWSHSQSPVASFYLNSIASCRNLLTLLTTWMSAQSSLKKELFCWRFLIFIIWFTYGILYLFSVVWRIN